MPKVYPLPLVKEQVDRILEEARISDDFDYMTLLVLKNTGRRIGELFGIEETNVIGRKIVGKRMIYIDGKPMEIDKTVPILKKTGNWRYGVKVKDISFDEEGGIMKVWVLKRRQYIQDETILTPMVAKVIYYYIKKYKLELEDFVFRKKSMRQIQNKPKVYAKRLGIPTRVEKEGIKYSLSLHSFRHYFITELKRKGWTNDMIAKLTGHKTISTLSIYDHVVATDIKEKVLEDLKDI